MTEEVHGKSLEGLRFTIELIKGQDFLRQLNESETPDPRFRSIKQGGVFEYAPLDTDTDLTEDNAWCILLKLDGLVVGIAELLVESGIVHFNSVTIDKNLRGLRRSANAEEKEMRLSERLLRGVFEYAEKKQSILQLGGFSTQGQERIRHQMVRLAQEYPVQVFF